MNWYKKAQAVQEAEIEDYFDIGHYNKGWEDDQPTDKKKRKIALWQSDITGSQFKVKEFDLFSSAVHEDEFEESAIMYQGRYDPIKNVVSVNMPVDPNQITRIVSSDEIPNRLIRQLGSSFPGASIYAFEYGSPPKAVA